MNTCAAAGVEFVNISPLRSDAHTELKADWMPVHPGSDTALMLGIAHTLVSEGLHDVDFLHTYAVGFEKFESYLMGKTDGQQKDVTWAAQQTGIEPRRIIDLARRMANGRTMISLAAGVQRADFGEQVIWMTVTLASMLGQIGLPGGGYTVGYGVNGNVGNIERYYRAGAISQGKNPIDEFLPVAMISDMLLDPGGSYQYQGQTCIFPDAVSYTHLTLPTIYSV